jgi:hypothetical protein
MLGGASASRLPAMSAVNHLGDAESRERYSSEQKGAELEISDKACASRINKNAVEHALIARELISISSR